MRSVNEIQTVTDAVMSVVEQQWPDHELPKTLSSRVRAAIKTSLTKHPNDAVTPPELASRWGISPDKVLNWIRNGELEAINVASSPSLRPSYRITEAAIEAFSTRRQPITQTPIVSRRRRKPNADVIEFF